MVKIIVYGSLRKGEYNYDRFKGYFGNGFNYIGTTSIVGYQIFDLGSYPGLKLAPVGQEDSRVTVDIMECSEECFKSIEAMELGAGYSTIKVADEKNPEDKYLAFMYNYNSGTLVESGDWSKYLSHEQALEV